MVPSPTDPAPLLPQQYKAFPLVIAHVLKAPPSTLAQTPLEPILFGEGRSVPLVRSPTCPWKFQPQQYIVSPTLTAHVWKSPASALAQAPLEPIFELPYEHQVDLQLYPTD